MRGTNHNRHRTVDRRRDVGRTAVEADARMGPVEQRDETPQRELTGRRLNPRMVNRLDHSSNRSRLSCGAGQDGVRRRQPFHHRPQKIFPTLCRPSTFASTPRLRLNDHDRNFDQLPILEPALAVRGFGGVDDQSAGSLRLVHVTLGHDLLGSESFCEYPKKRLNI